MAAASCVEAAVAAVEVAEQARGLSAEAGTAVVGYVASSLEADPTLADPSLAAPLVPVTATSELPSVAPWAGAAETSVCLFDDPSAGPALPVGLSVVPWSADPFALPSDALAVAAAVSPAWHLPPGFAEVEASAAGQVVPPAAVSGSQQLGFRASPAARMPA